jgi:tetratricopeptide (TPR) repeat protein
MTQETLNQAVAFHQQGRLADAEPLYRQVLGAGGNPQAQYLLAVLLYQQQRIPEAAAAAEAALARSPEAPEVLLLTGAIAQTQGKPAEALAALSAVTRRQPGHAEAWYNQGVVLAELGHPQDAIAAFDHALAIRPTAAAWLMRGVALNSLGRSEEALLDYDQALKLEPAMTGALYNGGIALLALRRFEDAVRVFDQVLAHNPKAHESWNNRGAALQEMGKRDAALESYDRAVAARPDYAVAWKNRGHVLTQLKRFDAAVDSYDRAVSHGLGTEIADAFSGRGDVLRHRERFAEAVASYDRALAMAPGSPEAWSNRAACLQMLRRYEEAQASVDRALALKPDHPHALAVKGSLLCELGRFAEGMESYARRAVLVHDGALASTAADPAFKIRHDGEQRAWLAERGVAQDRFHLEGGARLTGPAIDPANARTAAAAWAASNPKLVVIDDLLSPEALAGLRRFCLGSTMWKKPYPNGYLGAMPDHGFAAPLLAQIAEEMRAVFPAVFGQHGLGQWWGFKYDSSMAGIRIHADQAAVNVNFWITPDAANRNPANGGLVVWDKKPPLEWSSLRANGDEAAARQLLAQEGARPITVPYRANRAVIFDSDLFHETDTIEFREGYENRRINVTMLFGRRGD